MIERYAIYCKNSITGEWMAADKGFITKSGAIAHSKIYIGFEVEIREYKVSIF